MVGIRAGVAGAVGVARAVGAATGGPTALPGEQGNQGIGLVGLGALSDAQGAGLVEEDGAGGLDGSEHLGPGIGGEEAFQAEGPVGIGVVPQVAGIPDALVGGQGVLSDRALALARKQRSWSWRLVSFVSFAASTSSSSLVGSRFKTSATWRALDGTAPLCGGRVEARVVLHLVGQP